ncbi:hypothetical protein [Enterocloster citroniae]
MKREDLIKTIQEQDLNMIKEITKEKTPRKFITQPIDKEWKERIKENWWATNYCGSTDILRFIIKQYDGLMELRKRLLTIGGEEVCMPCYESDLDLILKYGQLWTGKPKMMQGESSACHYNSSLIWEENKKDMLIATGYGLSEDGMWRQHSWLIHLRPRSNKIIETTVPRIAYYGVALSYDLSLDFYNNNSV